MKKLSLLLAAVLMVGILAPRAHAIGVMGSWWQQDDLKDGYGLGLIHKFGIIPIISVDARASWLSFSGEPVEANLFPLEVTGRAKLGIFYGGVGVGYYIFDGKNDVKIDNDVGAYLAAGVQFTPMGIGGFGEVKYTFLETELDTGLGKSKLKANGVGINVGVVFGF